MEYLLKSSVVIAVFFACHYFFLRKETFFYHNRWFLLAGLLIATIFPFLVIPVEVAIEPIAQSDNDFIYYDNTLYESSSKPMEPSFDWISLLPILYGVGLLIFLIQFLFQFGSLILLLLKNPKNKDGIYTYVIINKKTSPFSFFKWIIYNPEFFTKEELDLMLTHEKIHAKQYHTIDLLLSQLACTVFWFNPLIWLYRKEVRKNLEFIADSKTQEISNAQKDYQRLLLKTSIGRQNMSISNHFNNSLIKERIVMLKKSRSKNKNRWKYLLMLPLLAGLLLSMNTEKVYVENESEFSASEKTLQFVVTKNTTDKELKAMTNTVKKNGGTLDFTQIRRNNKNEITNVFVKLYGYSYGGGNTKNPIESFIIYKELSGEMGGYVGRINGATIHFRDDLNKVSKKEINALSEKVHKILLKKNIYNEDDLKYVGKKLENATVPIKVVFKNEMSDKELDDIKQELKSKGIEMNIKKIKRNSEGKISAIKISFKKETGSANYNANDENGIKSFYFKMTDDTFGVGKMNAQDMIIVEEIQTDGNKKTSKSKSKTFIYNKSENKIYSVDSTKAKQYNDQRNVVIGRLEKKIEDNDTVYYSYIDSAEIEKLTKLKSNIYYQSQDPISIKNVDETIIIQKPGVNEQTLSRIYSNNDQPIFIIDGEQKSYDLVQNIDHNLIDEVTVIKGEKAKKEYGKKGENGVVIITTKEKKANPWKIRTEAYAVEYIGNEDALKKTSLAFISKYTPDHILEKNKKILEDKGLNVKYSRLKRNKSGEITRIKITISNNKGAESSASYKDNDGISSIEYGVSNDKLVVRTKRLETD